MVKILNLVLYSDNTDYYKSMYSILTNYYNHFDNVKTYFYKYNETINNDIEVIDNIINIKGKESYLPGILEKTLITFKYIEKEFEDYDYIIRSNISSIVDFSLLSKELDNNQIIYCGSTYIVTIVEFDVPSGIVNYKHFGTKFCSGTNIILSKRGYKLLMDNLHLIDKTIIDDVAIGIVFKELNIKLSNLSFNHNRYCNIPPNNLLTKYINDVISNKFIVYRNRNDFNRNDDVINMEFLTKVLIAKI